MEISKVGRRFHKEDRRYRRGRGPELVVVLDGVGCRAAERIVLACYVEELKPVRKLTSGGIEQKVTKVSKGRAGSKAEEDQGRESRGRFDYGWPLSPGERLLKNG